MIRAGLRPLPIPGQRSRIQAELVGQPRHRGLRSRGDIVGHEPQPRQRGELDGQSKPVSRATALARIHERHIRYGDPDQVDEQLTQPRRRIHIDLALHVDDLDAVLGVVTQLQVHTSSSAMPGAISTSIQRRGSA